MERYNAEIAKWFAEIDKGHGRDTVACVSDSITLFRPHLDKVYLIENGTLSPPPRS